MTQMTLQPIKQFVLSEVCCNGSSGAPLPHPPVRYAPLPRGAFPTCSPSPHPPWFPPMSPTSANSARAHCAPSRALHHETMPPRVSPSKRAVPIGASRVRRACARARPGYRVPARFARFCGQMRTESRVRSACTAPRGHPEQGARHGTTQNARWRRMPRQRRVQRRCPRWAPMPTKRHRK